MFKMLVFRAWLRKNQKDHPEFREVLRNEELFEMTFYGYIEDLEYSPQNLQNFLDWLLANKEELIEFIKLLIGLFG